MLRPCAPIGGSTWADFADQRDAMAGELPGALDRQRKQMAPGFDAGRGREWNAIAFRRRPTIRRRSAPSAVRLRSGAETHTTLQRLPGRGTNTHGPCGGVKLGRDIRVGPRMGDVEGQRRLMQIAAADLDAGGLAATAIAVHRRRPQAARRASRPCRSGSQRSHPADRSWRPHRRIRVRFGSSAARSSSAAISERLSML